MKLNIQLFADGIVVIETDLDTKGFDRQIAKLEYDLEELLEQYKEMEEAQYFAGSEEGKARLRELGAQIEKTSNKIVELKKKQEELNKTSKNIDFGFKNSLKSLTKIGLAVFGIRSAYMLIRQSADELAQSNDAVAGKLEAIKGSLTNAIAPVAETLVNLVYRLLSYLNAITKTFLGVDLFKQTAKSGKAAVGSAQKLKKTLAGFDEMNVLSDTSGGGGGGGGGGVPTPEPIDTSGFEEWLQKTREQWNELLEINRTDMAQMLLEQDKTWGLLKLGWFDTIQGIARIVTGFLDVFEGVFKIIKGIAEGNNDLIKEGVTKLIEGITGIITGLVQTILGLGEMIIGAVWGIIKTILQYITDFINKGVEKFNNFVSKIISFFTNLKDRINTIINNIKTFLVDKFGTLGGKVGDAIGGAFKAVVNKVLSAVETVLNSPIKSINKLLNVINAIPGINLKQLATFNLPRLAKGGIINQPTRGVPIALGGESGAEGVIPLTDSQQMALLGEAIGRYITINANITNNMNGRIISRELQRINNENSFASNR